MSEGGYGYQPIGKANERGNVGIRVTQCSTHGGLSAHIDMIVPISEIDAHKIRVYADNRIIADEI